MGVTFPLCQSVIDITKPPYNAKGDGITDDTQALQEAFNENVGWHRILYLPPGTYLITKTLTWPKRWKDHENWGFTTLQGEDAKTTTIRLKDRTFTDANKPQNLLETGGFGSADWFHNHVQSLTFHTGAGNPGAVALQFYANNYGAMRDCQFVSGDGQGMVGLDLSRNMNGPLLVQNITIDGFKIGIRTGNAVNSQTLENIRLNGQTERGIHNEGQALTLRNLRSTNTVTAVSSYGVLTLIQADLTGQGAASNLPAIVNYNGGHVFLRDVKTSGYRRPVADVATPDYAAALRLPADSSTQIFEYCSHPPTSPFPSPVQSLRLPIKETPRALQDDPKTWAIVDAFGADPTATRDSSAAIQKAIDSGATTIFFPGMYRVQSTVIVRGKAQRLLGVGGHINYQQEAKPTFRVEGGSVPLVFFEHFAHLGSAIEIATQRTLVFRSLNVQTIISRKTGDVFFEDVTTNNLAFRNQNVYARQLNVENEGLHVTNDGGKLWILGYKTERGGTLIETKNGGQTEVLGGFSYTTTAGKLAPMFVNNNASVFAFFGEVCYNGDPYETIIQEVRDGTTKKVRKGEGNALPYAGYATKQKSR
jgi:hypothetical protein